ncbi:9313_t:CDS:2 [Paraglomus occultum]|uniref:9313_t:CDS:1 n=1 Tax=Paraglomus occultum TaxID=144539 RepID=A0A9N8WQ54_9GLOM|nr:9313_t:CDS:2 [Paraglomus occultum]
MGRRSLKTLPPIGREPHSGVVFHARPRHYTILEPSPDELDQNESRWQDIEHFVTPPGHRAVVGHLQKDWEMQTKKQDSEKNDDNISKGV